MLDLLGELSVRVTEFRIQYPWDEIIVYDPRSLHISHIQATDDFEI